tara:strand:+ start:3870 stop:4292 length:423 start_codon:yes stop_codon:yes gene_type:complete
MYFGNIYPYFTEEEIRTALIRQIKKHNLNYVMSVFEEAWQSKFWREKGYDGATFIEDKTHPSLDVFLHDWGYRVYGGNKYDDYVFYKLQKILKDKAKRNYLGVRIGGFILRIKNRIIEKKPGTSTDNLIKLYRLLKQVKV